MGDQARWLIPDIPRAAVDALASELRLGKLAARLLLSRSIGSAAEARRFLAPSLEDLHDPWLMRDMRRAVDRLKHAIAAREKIRIYGDYDVDGTTAVVILKKAIELAGGAADYYVPHRLKEGYGMRAEVVEQAAADGVALIISVDTGIRAAEVVRHAAALGIDVIVTDHHLPEEEIPPAAAVLNPNRRDCPYPNKDLCGAGVAFKLVCGLMSELGWTSGRTARMAESFLKMVAIATIADVVPLTGENRVIVKHGLGGLGAVRNAGLRALLEVAGIPAGKSLSARQVAFRIAPRLNAAGRMDDARTAIEMFLTSDGEHARDLARQLHERNAERQQTEAEIVQQILAECERAPVDGQFALVFCGRDWHRGVLGIVASRLVERFNRPAIVLGEDHQGLAQGSGRSIPGFHLLDALEFMPDVFVRFGGHKHAAGLTLAAGRVAEFRARLNQYAAARLTPDDLAPQLEADAAVEFDEISETSVAEVLQCAPFGCGNDEPLFVTLNAEVAGPPQVFKEKHLKVNLRKNGRSVIFKAWNFAARMDELVPGTRVDAAFRLEEDAWALENGGENWCALLQDVRASGVNGCASSPT
jgi:single-stranded-DNA-specific exonuclease